MEAMNTARYVQLLSRFPPQVIRSRAQLARTESEIESLLARKERLDDSEEAYLDLLARLVEDWEDEHVAMPDISGVDLLKVLLEDRGLTQRDLVRAGVFATDSIASEVLAGKRSLTVVQIARLARNFALPADLFLPKPPAARSDRKQPHRSRGVRPLRSSQSEDKLVDDGRRKAKSDGF
jgi:HTH-type transcriptional regulator / antitoxin HigA